MNPATPSRRALLAFGPAVLGAFGLPRRAAAQTGGTEGFTYEVSRSDAEWRAILTPSEYMILREGATEAPRSDERWDSTAAGIYACRGCDLPNFDARWKVVLDKGWLFYRHAQPDTLLTSIDRTVYDRFAARGESETGPIMSRGMFDANVTPEEQALLDSFLAIEVHCRRCASHLGHLLLIDRQMLFCVNGTGLSFTPEAA